MFMFFFVLCVVASRALIVVLFILLSLLVSGDVPLPERLHGEGRGYGARRDGADPELLGLLRGGLPYASPHGVSHRRRRACSKQ